ncbi:MAG TPA: MBL fold metallo-hydrolase [Actinobacteria bacterium]|nr:MBL fold metallo-hydrolase [Actinomycetota bacterium]
MRVELVLAPNPGPMTGPGTNTWVVVAGGEAVVIDPGPVIAAHLDAIVAALAGVAPVGVLVTHTHPDHAPAAPPLAQRLGIPTIGPGPGGGFSPDRRIADGDVVEFGGARLVALATPGHTADSTCYRIGDALFTGDHIMGGSTVMVEDMKRYLDSLTMLHRTGLRVIYPGHGPIMRDPDRTIGEYLEHRRQREAQILAAIDGGATTVGAVVRKVYAEVDPRLHPAAAVSVDAHLRKLADEGVVDYRGGGWTGPVAVMR